MAGSEKGIEELVSTLNDKQKAYVNLALPDEKNGEYMLSVFRLVPGKNLSLLQAAAEVAAALSGLHIPGVFLTGGEMCRTS